MIRVDWSPGDETMAVSFRFYQKANRLIGKTPGARFLESNGKRTWEVSIEHYQDLHALFPGEVVGPPVWRVLGQDPPPPPQWLQDLEPTLMEPIEDLKMPLYDYQVRGANFAVWCVKQHGLGGIWDVMGLGKTPQSIAAIVKLKQEGLIEGPVLFVTKAPLVNQTVREGFEKFSDLSAVGIHGTPKQRLARYQRSDVDVFVMGYELVLRDQEILAGLGISLACFDEVHKLKDRGGKMYKGFKSLLEGWKCPAILLTGTPVQNRAEELYALFSLHPKGEELLGKPTAFAKQFLRTRFNGRFQEIMGYQNLHVLADIVGKHYIRRTRDDVSIELPDLQEIPIWVDPTPEQSIIFAKLKGDEELLKREIPHMKPEDREKAEKQMQGNMLMQMAAANDPNMFRFSKSFVVRRDLGHCGKDGSPKREMFKTIIEEQVELGKVLVFSQFTTMLNLLAENLDDLGIGYVMYTGEESDRARDEAVERLRHDPGVQVMLATNAASDGLNLQCCRSVIHFDSPWNPTVYDQRVGRIQRPNATHDTALSIQLLCRESIDERILESQKIKRDLAGVLLH